MLAVTNLLFLHLDGDQLKYVLDLSFFRDFVARPGLSRFVSYPLLSIHSKFISFYSSSSVHLLLGS